MTVDFIKRSEFKKFLNTTPSSTATYELIGDGIVDGTVNYNPEATTEQYIHQDSASSSVEGYAPTLPIDAVCRQGDGVFDYIDGLRKARATFGDAETDMVMVYLYETPTGSEYPAEKQPVCIQIDSFGGEKKNKITYTINFNGDPTSGTFNPSTKAFTPNP